jgi:hypothetical protein
MYWVVFVEPTPIAWIRAAMLSACPWKLLDVIELLMVISPVGNRI